MAIMARYSRPALIREPDRAGYFQPETWGGEQTIRQPTGFYLIKAADSSYQPLDQVRYQVHTQLIQEAFKKEMDAITDQYKVTVGDRRVFHDSAGQVSYCLRIVRLLMEEESGSRSVRTCGRLERSCTAALVRGVCGGARKFTRRRSSGAGSLSGSGVAGKALRIAPHPDPRTVPFRVVRSATASATDTKR